MFCQCMFCVVSVIEGGNVTTAKSSATASGQRPHHEAGAVALTEIPGFNPAVARLPAVGSGGVVPYIARWNAEDAPPTMVIERAGLGVAFADELPADRDRDGVLWARALSLPGQGQPHFKEVHPLRQQQAMRRLLCQVCAEPADRTEQGVLWLLLDYRQDWPGWPEDMANTGPPLCLPCARASVRVCPGLRKGFVAIRAHSQVAGVYGARYRAGRSRPIVVADEIVTYDDPAIRWIVAAQLVRSLHGCTIVDLDRC
jgi:hypothetical protein